MAARGGPGGDWISYPEAQERIHAGLPVEVLDPLSPEWRVERFTSHVSMRHYRIPGKAGPDMHVISNVREGDVVRVYTATGVQVAVGTALAGDWQLILRRVS